MQSVTYVKPDRAMATIRLVDDILPIEGADAIEVAVVGGWKVVVKKGEFVKNSMAIYFEIDSFIPSTVAPFLTKPGHFPKEFNGIQGERLKTIKLRGQISQGLLLPVNKSSDGVPYISTESPYIFVPVTIGDDVSEVLQIQKWEKPEEFRILPRQEKCIYLLGKGFPNLDSVNVESSVADWVKATAVDNVTFAYTSVTETNNGGSLFEYIKSLGLKVGGELNQRLYESCDSETLDKVLNNALSGGFSFIQIRDDNVLNSPEIINKYKNSFN